jgi:hypothetical protein
MRMIAACWAITLHSSPHGLAPKLIATSVRSFEYVT